ncbi:hypothetical protein J6590_002946 [Homalodisca vitripennis]|nr:hypothetical protein J6590_002946 [Homalodisca vitripennis]
MVCLKAEKYLWPPATLETLEASFLTVGEARVRSSQGQESHATSCTADRMSNQPVGPRLILARPLSEIGYQNR